MEAIDREKLPKTVVLFLMEYIPIGGEMIELCFMEQTQKTKWRIRQDIYGRCYHLFFPVSSRKQPQFVRGPKTSELLIEYDSQLDTVKRISYKEFPHGLNFDEFFDLDDGRTGKFVPKEG